MSSFERSAIAVEASRPKTRRMLVFDSAYTYRIMQERQVAVLATCRDLGGYFEHVWTVHPVATLLDPQDSVDSFRAPVTYELAERHTMIEGSAGRYHWLRWLAPLNLLIAQVQLFRRLTRLV